MGGGETGQRQLNEGYRHWRGRRGRPVLLAEHVRETEQVVTAINEMSRTAVFRVGECGQHRPADPARASNWRASPVRWVDQATASVTALVDEVEATAHPSRPCSRMCSRLARFSGSSAASQSRPTCWRQRRHRGAWARGTGAGGFAVVDEVRSLAARTQQSTAEIQTMLTRLQRGTQTVVAAMGNTRQSCQDAAGNTSKVNASLDLMAGEVVEINDPSATRHGRRRSRARSPRRSIAT